MNKRVCLIIAAAFLFFYILNLLMPLAFGDDYLYAFIWQGNPMNVPLTEDAVKVTSFGDLLLSQISFYYTWSGRVVNNTLSQLFVWAGKGIFNIFNAFACVLLVLEIYWCANKGKITFQFDIYRLAWLFLFFWLFTPSFPSVVFWLVGACHYLWPAVFLTGFLIPYIHKFYFSEKQIVRNRRFSCFMFLFGVIAGCTNENSVCWVIALLLVFVFVNRKFCTLEHWLCTGLAGLLLGYAVLMFSPGNYARLAATHGNNWFNISKLLENLHIFAIVLVIQFLLWYFCLRSLPQIFKVLHACEATEKKQLKKELVLMKALSVTAVGMSVIMLFSPEFHLRSAFPGTVHLMIVTGIVLRVQKEYDITLLQKSAARFLTYVGIAYFIVSAGFTLQHLYDHQDYNKKLMEFVIAAKNNENDAQTILQIEPFPALTKEKDFLSGYHMFEMNLKEDANSWINVAFSRYYGIPGIRVLDRGKKGLVPENNRSN